ncbi:MAG: hypothetical protein JNL21_17425, partial [Myxococcales bacterium]|nr:hypothetical protein [Myxococcales bacterium]
MSGSDGSGGGFGILKFVGVSTRGLALPTAGRALAGLVLGRGGNDTAVSFASAGTDISMVRVSSESGRRLDGPGRRDEGGAGIEDSRRADCRIAWIAWRRRTGWACLGMSARLAGPRVAR